MLSLFPRDVLDEMWDLIESVSESFPTYVYLGFGSSRFFYVLFVAWSVINLLFVIMLKLAITYYRI